MANLYSVPLKNAVQKSLGGTLLQAETSTITLDSSVVGDLQASAQKPGVLVVDRIDSNGTELPNSREYISFTGVSGSTVTGLTRGIGGSSAQDHAVGAIVEFLPDIVWAQALNDVIETEHNYQGKHTAITASSASIYNLTVQNNLTTNNLTSNNLNIGTNLLNASTASLNTVYVSNLLENGLNTFNASTASISVLRIYTHLNASGASISGLETSPVGSDGWTSISDTCTYASATTFTIAGVDRTSVFTKGTRIKLTQTSAKYFVVVSSSFSTNTTVTITGGTDYTLANAAITSPYYSYAANPQGYPTWFAYTPTWTGFSAAPTSTLYFQVVGTLCTFYVVDATAGTSDALTLTFTLPIAAKRTISNFGSCFVLDNSSQQTVLGHMRSTAGSATVAVRKSWFDANFTASGTKNFYPHPTTYEIN